MATRAGVREAHLPQCYIAGVVDPSTQVLVVVLPDGSDGPNLAARIAEDLKGLSPGVRELLVWPVSADNEILAAVRNAGCQIIGVAPPRKPWWNFWT